MIFFFFFACIVQSKHGSSPCGAPDVLQPHILVPMRANCFLFHIMFSLILKAGNPRHWPFLFLLTGGVPMSMFAPEIPSQPIRNSEQQFPRWLCMLACWLFCWTWRLWRREVKEIKLYQMLYYDHNREESRRRFYRGLRGSETVSAGWTSVVKAGFHPSACSVAPGQCGSNYGFDNMISSPLQNLSQGSLFGI